MATYDDNDRKLAQNLCKQEDTMALLERVFCPDRSKLRAELEKNIVALSDEDYGKAMKVLVAQEAHFASAMNELRRIGSTTAGKSGDVAPR